MVEHVYREKALFPVSARNIIMERLVLLTWMNANRTHVSMVERVTIHLDLINVPVDQITMEIGVSYHLRR